MRLKQFYKLFFLVLLFSSCRHQPDSSGKVYDISPDKAEQELLAALNEIIDDDNENAEAYYRRSRLLYEDQKFNKSSIDIDKALSIDSDNKRYLIQKAKVLFELKESYKCYRLLQKVKSEEKSLEVKKIELISGIQTGVIKDALKIESAITKMGFSEGRKSYLLGMIAWDKKDTSTTKKHLMIAYKEGQKEESILLILAKLSDSDEEAGVFLHESAKKYEGRRSRLALSEYYARQSKWEEEDSIYSIMLQLNKKDEEVISRKVRLYNSEGKNQEIISLLEKHASTTKSLADDRILADAYFALRKNEEAKILYNQLLSVDTTGQVASKLRIIKWRRQQSQTNNFSSSLGTNTKDTLNSRP